MNDVVPFSDAGPPQEQAIVADDDVFWSCTQPRGFDPRHAALLVPTTHPAIVLAIDGTLKLINHGLVPCVTEMPPPPPALMQRLPD